MHSLHEHIFLDDFFKLKGFTFGFVHISIMLIGYYSGWSINRALKLVSNGYIAGVFGAVISHIVADLIASLLDPNFREMVLGIFIGGLIPLLFIPLLEKYIVRSKNNIVVSDHENVKKDLDSN